jgi:hypothetical protein
VNLSVSTLPSATNLVEIRTLSQHRVALAAKGAIHRCYTIETTIPAALTLNSAHPKAPSPDLAMETSEQPPRMPQANPRPHRTTVGREEMTVPFAATRRSGLTLQGPRMRRSTAVGRPPAQAPPTVPSQREARRAQPLAAKPAQAPPPLRPSGRRHSATALKPSGCCPQAERPPASARDAAK